MSNIIMITTCYPTPKESDTYICHYFTREWVKMGHKVIVFKLTSSFPSFYYLLAKNLSSLVKRIAHGSDIQSQITDRESYLMEGVLVYNIPVKKLIPHGKFSRHALWRTYNVVLSCIESNNFVPDMIVGHWVNPTLFVLAKLKEKYPSAQTSLTLHGETYNIMAKRFSNCDELLKKIDYIGFRSPTVKVAFNNSCPYEKKWFYCYSGVSEFFLNNLPAIDEKYSDSSLFKFIYIGRLVEYKYPKAIIEALEFCYEKGNYELSYVGRKSDMYEELERYVNSNNFQERIHFKGLIPREQIPSVLDHNQCLIMISKGEVFGMVFIEAMARGCIVIAGADSGVQEIIHHGENGFLCEPGNVDDLAKIIIFINGLTKNEKMKIAANARKTAEELSDANVASLYLKEICK